MQLKAFLALAWLVVAGLLDYSEVRAAETVVAQVEILKGTAVRRAPNNVEHELRIGDQLYLHDRLETRGSSLLSIRLRDKTLFFLGPEAALSLDDFKFDSGEDDSLQARIIKGAFRFVTGLVAKRKARSMKVQTGAVATIGIRGTTVGGEVVGESATVVLLEADPQEDAEPAPSAIEVGNSFGSVVIDQTGYGTHVPDAHSPPTPPQRMRLRTIDNLMRSIQSIQRMAVPRPTAPAPRPPMHRY